MKKISIFSGLLLCLSFLLLPVLNVATFAVAESQQSANITYFAFGDSITEGTVITKNGDDGNENLLEKVDDDGSNYYTKNRYADVLVNQLEAQGVHVNYQNHADASDKLDDFVNVYQSVDGLDEATLVTVCIGANDILGQAVAAIQTGLQSILLDIVAGTATSEQVQATIVENIETSMAEGAEYCYNNFENQLGQFLANINDRANVVVTTVYNPYQDVVLKLNLQIDYFIQRNVTISIDFSSLTEKYLSATGSFEHTINKTIAEAVDSLQSSGEVQNLTLVDIYNSFDSVYSSEGINSYKDLILVKDEIRNSPSSPYVISVTDPTALDVNAISAELSYLLDPHLTDDGHQLFYSSLYSALDGSCSPEDFTLTAIKNGSSQPLSFEQTNYIQAASDEEVTLTSSTDVFLDILSASSLVSSSSEAGAEHILPLSQLSSDNYVLRFTPTGSSCYYDVALNLTLTEPETPPQTPTVNVYLNQKPLENGQSLTTIKAGENIFLTTDKDVYVKIINGDTVVNGFWTTNKNLLYTFDNQGDFKIELYENQTAENPIFELSISVKSTAKSPILTAVVFIGLPVVLIGTFVAIFISNKKKKMGF